MSEKHIRDALYSLAADSVKAVQNANEVLTMYEGAVAFAQWPDERFTQLPSFSKAISALNADPIVQAQCGPQEATRLALQFIYSLFGVLQLLVLDESAFEKTWAALWAELSTNEWTYRGVATLQNFKSASSLLDLGDGISIRARSASELAPLLGCNVDELERLLWDDSLQGAFGSHVLFVEAKSQKKPENFYLTDFGDVWTKAYRVLLALRLCKPGDLRIGRLFWFRPEAFNVGLRGRASMGYSRTHIGPDYCIEASDVPSVFALYDLLMQFQDLHHKQLGNIGLALRSFSSIYERFSHQAEDSVLDAITAIETLLGDIAESTFKLAFRTAGILGGTDDQRVDLFERTNLYYDTRSRIVHGGELKPKHVAVIKDAQPLVDIARRVLVAFLRFAAALATTKPPTEFNDHDTFKKWMDSALQHTGLRAKLRAQMGLT